MVQLVTLSHLDSRVYKKSPKTIMQSPNDKILGLSMSTTSLVYELFLGWVCW